MFTQCSDCSHSARKHRSASSNSDATASRQKNKERNESISSYKVIEVDENILKLRKGRLVFFVQLLGINPTRQVENYLKDFVGSEVSLIFDSYRNFSRINKNDKVRAYVIQSIGVCINSKVLKEKVSLLNDEYMRDSLVVYNSYATLNAENKLRNKESGFSIESIRASTFRVDNYNSRGYSQGFGTGFFITDTGIGISNYHVFDNGSQWKLTLCSDNDSYKIEKANILHYDQALDYILFQVPNLTGNSFIPISNGELEQGNEIFVYGNPKGLSCTLSKGIVSAIRDKDHNGINELIQIDAAISPGNSGGPVISKNGLAIGVATMKYIDCENCNFAMNLDALEIEKYLSKEKEMHSKSEEENGIIGCGLSSKKLYSIAKFVDGDTFWVENGCDGVKIRLIGIDAPESRNMFGTIKVEPFGKEASQYIEEFLSSKQISLEFDVDSLDRYGRTLAYCFTEDGTFINEHMVKKGLAVSATFQPNIKYQERFLKAQRMARRKQVGIWGN